MSSTRIDSHGLHCSPASRPRSKNEWLIVKKRGRDDHIIERDKELARRCRRQKTLLDTERQKAITTSKDLDDDATVLVCPTCTSANPSKRPSTSKIKRRRKKRRMDSLERIKHRQNILIKHIRNLALRYKREDKEDIHDTDITSSGDANDDSWQTKNNNIAVAKVTPEQQQVDESKTTTGKNRKSDRQNRSKEAAKVSRRLFEPKNHKKSRKRKRNEESAASSLSVTPCSRRLEFQESNKEKVPRHRSFNTNNDKRITNMPERPKKKSHKSWNYSMETDCSGSCSSINERKEYYPKTLFMEQNFEASAKHLYETHRRTVLHSRHNEESQGESGDAMDAYMDSEDDDSEGNDNISTNDNSEFIEKKLLIGNDEIMESSDDGENKQSLNDNFSRSENVDKMICNSIEVAKNPASICRLPIPALPLQSSFSESQIDGHSSFHAQRETKMNSQKPSLHQSSSSSSHMLTQASDASNVFLPREKHVQAKPRPEAQVVESQLSSKSSQSTLLASQPQDNVVDKNKTLDSLCNNHDKAEGNDKNMKKSQSSQHQKQSYSDVSTLSLPQPATYDSQMMLASNSYHECPQVATINDQEKIESLTIEVNNNNNNNNNEEELDPLTNLVFWKRIIRQQSGEDTDKTESKQNTSYAMSFRHALADLVIVKNEQKIRQQEQQVKNKTEQNVPGSNLLWLPTILEGNDINLKECFEKNQSL